MASPTCVLVDVRSSIEVLPAGTSPYDALEQVNEVATSLAKQTVKGDACLVHQSCGQEQLDTLLQSRPWKRAQPIRQPGTPRANSSSSQQSCHLVDTQPIKDNCFNSSITERVSISSHALKRARSVQLITAANSMRQRILRSMTAAATNNDDLYSSTPPQQSCTRPVSSSTGPHGLPPVHTGRQQATGSEQAKQQCCLSVQQQQQQQENSMYDTTPFRLNNGVRGPMGCLAQKPVSLLDCTAEAWQPGSYSSSKLGNFRRHSCTTTSNRSSMPCGTAAASDRPLCDVAADPSGLLQLCSSNVAQQQHKHAHLQVSADTQQQLLEDDMTIEQCDQQFADDVDMADIGEAVRQCTVPCATSSLPTWEELSDDVIGRVAGFLGPAVSALMPVYLTCRSWRRAVLEDDRLLLNLSFKLNVARPFKPTSAHTWHAVVRQRHPALLLRAAKLGNVSGLVTCAHLLDAAGCPEEAMRCWRRAAKSGHVEGQLVYGLGLYRGIAGLVQDAEEAHMWLLRALKQVQKPETAASASSSSKCVPSSVTVLAAMVESTAAGVSASNATPADSQIALAAAGGSTSSVAEASCSGTVSSSLCPTELAVLTDWVRAQAGLVLGYLAFDGEGTIKVDRQEAVKYFKMAAGAGCKEAEQVLGWIYSTGQYG